MLLESVCLGHYSSKLPDRLPAKVLYGFASGRHAEGKKILLSRLGKRTACPYLYSVWEHARVFSPAAP